MRPLFRGVVAAAALSLAPIAVVTTTAAPAQAAATVNTVTTFDAGIKKRGEFGDLLYITGRVKAQDDPSGTGDTVYGGVSYLQRQSPGSSTWKNVAKDETPGYSSFPDYSKYKSNAKFRIYFAGGVSDPGESNERTYPPSVSKAITIKVFRTFDVQSVSGKRRPTADVKVSPKFGKKTLLVQKQKGKRYKPFRKVKTNKKGKVRLSLPGSSKGITYRLVAPKDKNFLATKTTVTATQY